MKPSRALPQTNFERNKHPAKKGQQSVPGSFRLECQAGRVYTLNLLHSRYIHLCSVTANYSLYRFSGRVPSWPLQVFEPQTNESSEVRRLEVFAPPRVYGFSGRNICNCKRPYVLGILGPRLTLNACQGPIVAMTLEEYALLQISHLDS